MSIWPVPTSAMQPQTCRRQVWGKLYIWLITWDAFWFIPPMSYFLVPKQSSFTLICPKNIQGFPCVLHEKLKSSPCVFFYCRDHFLSFSHFSQESNLFTLFLTVQALTFVSAETRHFCSYPDAYLGFWRLLLAPCSLAQA